VGDYLRAHLIEEEGLFIVNNALEVGVYNKGGRSVDTLWNLFFTFFKVFNNNRG